MHDFFYDALCLIDACPLLLVHKCREKRSGLLVTFDHHMQCKNKISNINRTYIIILSIALYILM